MRPLAEGDAEAMRALWEERDPRAARRITKDGHPTVVELKAQLRAEAEKSEATGIRLYAIERAMVGLVGYCGLIVGRANAAEPNQVSPRT